MTQLFINLIGHNASGKSTLAQKLAAELGASIVSGDMFREFIRQNVHFFSDTDLSYPNETSAMLDPLISTYRSELTNIILHGGQTVLFDGGVSKAAYRQSYLSQIAADFPNVKTVILYADINEPALVERLRQRDAAKPGSRWLKQYEDLKKTGFEAPQEGEADVLLTFDQTNYADVLDSLKELSK